MNRDEETLAVKDSNLTTVFDAKLTTTILPKYTTLYTTATETIDGNLRAKYTYVLPDKIVDAINKYKAAAISYNNLYSSDYIATQGFEFYLDYAYDYCREIADPTNVQQFGWGTGSTYIKLIYDLTNDVFTLDSPPPEFDFEETANGYNIIIRSGASIPSEYQTGWEYFGNYYCKYNSSGGTS